MRVIQTAERTVAIWFIHEEAPPPGKALALIRGALRHSGFEPWAYTEADCFPAGEETLLIARQGQRHP